MHHENSLFLKYTYRTCIKLNLFTFIVISIEVQIYIVGIQRMTYVGQAMVGPPTQPHFDSLIKQIIQT